jgi:hypothetical protein
MEADRRCLTSPVLVYGNPVSGPEGVRISVEMHLLIAITAVLSLLTFSGKAQALTEQCQQVVMAERASGGFGFGHIDNPLEAPIVGRDFWGRVVGKHDDQPTASASVQLRGKGTHGKIVTSETGQSGVFRFDNLPPGVYFFVAVARGFQSVSGCVVIQRRAGKRPPVLLRLPLGV